MRYSRAVLISAMAHNSPPPTQGSNSASNLLEAILRLVILCRHRRGTGVTLPGCHFDAVRDRHGI